jgi:hypothetical protein
MKEMRTGTMTGKYEDRNDEMKEMMTERGLWKG